MYLPGYVRSLSSTARNPAWTTGDTVRELTVERAPWEYSEAALAIVAEYKKAFPNVFTVLEAFRDAKT